MRLISLFKQGKLISSIDMGETAPGGAFVGLERVYDAVEVSS